jgi:hypothetical protein
MIIATIAGPGSSDRGARYCRAMGTVAAFANTTPRKTRKDFRAWNALAT